MADGNVDPDKGYAVRHKETDDANKVIFRSISLFIVNLNFFIYNNMLCFKLNEQIHFLYTVEVALY